MPTFLHAADLHLDSPLRGLGAYEGAPRDHIREAPRRALDNLVALALRERVVGVIVAGDVYDTDPLLESALFFRSRLQRLHDAGIPVAIVRGNHDHAAIAPRNVALPPSVRIFDASQAETWELAPGLHVHGRSYPRRDVTESTFVDAYLPPVAGVLNVGVLHTALTGSADHASYAPTSPAHLWAKGYQYWALGHIHRRQEWLDVPLADGGVPIVFPGNLQGRDVRETGAKGATLVTYTGTRVTALRHVPLDVVRWHHVVLDAALLAAGDPRAWVRDQVLAQTAADRDGQRLCAVRVTLRGAASGPAARLASASLREYLQGELQTTADALWLEKVAVDIRPVAQDADVLESHLRDLAATLCDDEDERRSLGAELRHVRELLRKADPELLDAAALPPADGALTPQQVRDLLEQALDLLRDTLAR